MQSESTHLSSILGVDIGGTFTDIVYYIPPLTPDSVGQLIVHKVPSTPKNPAQGLLNGMQDIDVARYANWLRHLVFQKSSFQDIPAYYLL